MSYSIYWTEEDLQEASDIYNCGVSERLEEALEEKQRQVKWYDEISRVVKRFHNVFGINGLDVAEISFSFESREFRALCIIVKSEEAVVYFDLVDKGGSNQRRKLEDMKDRQDEISRVIRQRLDRSSS